LSVLKVSNFTRKVIGAFYVGEFTHQREHVL